MKKRIKIGKIFIYLIAVVFPLFFLPFFRNSIDYPKKEIFFILTTLAFLSWGIGLVLKKKAIKFNFLIIPFLIIVLALGISSAFSLNKTNSFLGKVSNPTDNFVTFGLFFLVSFLILQTFDRKDIVNFLKTFIFSASLAALINLFQIFGLYFPGTLANPSFNLFARISAASLISAIFLPLSLIFLFIEKRKGQKILFSLAALIFLTSLVVYDLRLAWVELFLLSITISVFGSEIEFSKKGIVWNVIWATLIVVSIFFFFSPINISSFPRIPNEVSPGFGTEMDIIRGIKHTGIKSIFFGLGPGNFVYGYNKHHSPALNQTFFWNTRFASGDSTVFDWFITKGIIGVFALLFFYGWLVWRLFVVARKNKGENYKIVVCLSSILATMILITFFYSFNFSLWLLFWLLVGIFMVLDNSKSLNIPLNKPIRYGFLISGYFVILALMIILLFWEGKVALADASYYRANFSKNIDETINYLQRAANFNPKDDLYWKSLGQSYLIKANSISQSENISQEDKANIVNELIKKGIDAFNRAVKIDPHNPANWNSQGYFYRNLIGINGAGEIALASYRKAIELEPASPFSYTEMARTYILMAQNFAKEKKDEKKNEALRLAKVKLEKAISLKNNYAPAYYLLAVVYDQKGDQKEAINKLEETKKYAPKDTGVLFQLGMLYWRTNQLEKAKENFEKAIDLKPDYSNALYMLGLIYDKEGNDNKAIELFKRVLELNPQNKEVKRILENLKNGKPALEGIVVSEEPIKEEPLQIEKSGTELNP